ncbi:MAG: hypothetical protein AAGA95_09005 [Pseudomonadota bacterium]
MTRAPALWKSTDVAVQTLATSFGLTFATALLLSPTRVVASHHDAAENDALREKVSIAYGRKALDGLRSMHFVDEYRETFRGQGYTPGYDDFWVIHAETIIDLATGRGSYESWSDQYGRIMQFHTLSTPAGVANVDYETGFYSIDAEATYYQAFGRNLRASDTLLAHELVKPDSELERFGDRVYLGRLHSHVALTVPASPPLHLYIDAETGYIQRMHRSLPNGVDIVYVFENHRKHNGLVFAREYRVFIDGELLLVTRARKVSTNLDAAALDSAFALPDGLQAEPERIQFDGMQVVAVSDRLHHVGQNDFSSFYDAGDYLIGLGGYGGLKERLDAYWQKLGHEKPLRYQLATHHHSDHTAGLAEAAELGAKIVLPEAISAKVRSDHPSLRTEQLIGYTDFYELDTLQMHVFSTSHAETMVAIYVPEARTLFQEDHYVRMFKSTPGAITRNSYTFYREVAKLNLAVEKLLSVHGGHVEAWREFASSASAYAPSTCFRNRPLCPEALAGSGVSAHE